MNKKRFGFIASALLLLLSTLRLRQMPLLSLLKPPVLLLLKLL